MKILQCFFLGFILVMSGAVYAEQTADKPEQQVDTLEALLKLVEQARISESREQKQREQAFKSEKSQQKKMLEDTEREKREQEKISERLENEFEENEELIAVKQELLQKRLGSLTELFGHLTSTAGDLRSEIATSIISAQYPGREVYLTRFIDKMSGSSELPTVEEIERLWFESQREMTESGNVVAFIAPVTDLDGSRKDMAVMRVGTFNLTTDGQYVNYDNGNMSVLARQPSVGFIGNPITGNAAALQQAGSGYHAFSIDPTGPNGGSYLSALIDTPSLVERWKQGGYVGIVITLLAVYALVLAIYRMFAVAGIKKTVMRQLQSSSVSADNPLGRVLQVFESHRHLDIESLEYKLAEAILEERPGIEKGVSSLKIIAMVAPLLGLLGTVVGMIMTFQAITIYGAGDPQAMAGGISSALVTTVLGLCVAIPTVMLHAILSYRSKQILSILEQQSYGLVAEKVEVSEAA